MAVKSKILMIDDDPDFVNATREALENRGYEVFAAENGEMGLELARKIKPDLILLDIIMPARNGFSTAEQLKKDTQLKNIPTLMLTAFSSKHAESTIPVGRGLELEVEDYIDKSAGTDELLKRIADQLKKVNK